MQNKEVNSAVIMIITIIITITAGIIGWLFAKKSQEPNRAVIQSQSETRQVSDKKIEWKKYYFIGHIGSFEYPANFCDSNNNCSDIYPVEEEFGNTVFIGSLNKATSDKGGDRIQTVAVGLSFKQDLYVKSQSDAERFLKDSYIQIKETVRWATSKENANIKTAKIKLANNNGYVYVVYNATYEKLGEGALLSFSLLDGAVFGNEIDNIFLKSIKLGDVSLYSE